MPLIILAMMLRRAVQLPFQDEWTCTALSVALHHGTLTWPLIWAQHNEHRDLVGNLIFLALDRTLGWNVVAEQLVSFAILVVGQSAAWQIVRSTTPPARRWPLFAVVTLLMWTLAQYQNFAIGYTVGWNVCTTAFLVLLAALSERAGIVRFAIAAVCAVVAPFASDQGVLLFPLGFVLLARQADRRVPALIVWSVIAIATGAAFLSGYHVPVAAAHAPPAGVVLVYLLTVLGNPIGAWWGLATCAAVGLLGLAGFARLVVRPEIDARVRLVWLCAALYAIVNAVIIALSRWPLGLETALASHYAAITLFLFVGIAGLTAAAWDAVAGLPRPALIAAGVLIAYGVLDADLHGNRAWQMYTHDRRTEICALAVHDDAVLTKLGDIDGAEIEPDVTALIAVNDLPYRAALSGCAIPPERGRR